MGTLTYGTGLCFDFDDRTLAHLQVVMGLKLRRREWLEEMTVQSNAAAGLRIICRAIEQ